MHAVVTEKPAKSNVTDQEENIQRKKEQTILKLGIRLSAIEQQEFLIILNANSLYM